MALDYRIGKLLPALQIESVKNITSADIIVVSRS